MGEFSVVYAACATQTHAGFMVSFAPAMFCEFGKLRPSLLRSVATLICVMNLQLAFRSEAVKPSDGKLIAERDACQNVTSAKI